MAGGQMIHVLWNFILIIIIFVGMVDTAYRSRRNYVSTGLLAAVPPGQQYGQPGATMYGQPQSGVPPQYGQPLQYGQPPQYGQPNPFGQQSSYAQPNSFGQQSAFGQPDENQFSYSSQKY